MHYLRCFVSFRVFSTGLVNTNKSCYNSRHMALSAISHYRRCRGLGLGFMERAASAAETCEVTFCRVCGFRVRVWESYRTSRSFGYGYGSYTELREVSGGYKICCTRNRVLWHGAYRTHRSSWYGYECATELTQVPGAGMKVLQNFQKFRVLWHGRTELTEVPGRTKNPVPVPRVL